jgi:hypothetical protein
MGYFGPHPAKYAGQAPYPSASGMLRDPEHDRLLLVAMPAGEGFRMGIYRPNLRKKSSAISVTTSAL